LAIGSLSEAPDVLSAEMSLKVENESTVTADDLRKSAKIALATALGVSAYDVSITGVRMDPPRGSQFWIFTWPPEKQNLEKTLKFTRKVLETLENKKQ